MFSRFTRRLAATTALLVAFVVTPTALAASPTEVGLVDADQGMWYLQDSATGVTTFFYGNPGDFPLMGDWDCNGTDTPGMYRQSDGFVYVRNSNSVGIADRQFFLGNPGDVPLAGDFNNDGCDTVSIYRPSEQRFYIANKLAANNAGINADFSFLFGNPGDKPVTGDWDADGITEIGLHRETTGFFYWRNTLDTGIASDQIFFGDPGDRFVAGDWGVVDGTDTPAIFRPSDLNYYFRHTLTQGIADSQFTWTGAGSGWLPVAGMFSNVKITMNTVIPDEGLPFGPFTATGPAVDAGWVCPSGNMQDLTAMPTFFEGGAVFRGDRIFVCQDGSGTFTARFQATVIFEPFSGVGSWMLEEGTGNYVNLGGAGELAAFESATFLLEFYTGTVDIN